MFPFLWDPKLSLCLSHSNSQLSNTQHLHPRSRLNLHMLFKKSVSSQTELTVKSKSKLRYNWWSVDQSFLLSGTHLGPATNFSHLFFNYFRQLRVCWCGEPSLTGSRVCSFQFLLCIASAAWGMLIDYWWESQRERDH
jgi:hypothetical protein